MKTPARNDSLFEGSYHKIARGRKHCSELEILLCNYGARLITRYTPLQNDPEKSVLEASEPPPIEMPLIIGDAIHNFRSALDIMLCEISDIEIGSSKDVMFPFAQSAEEYEKRVERMCKGLSADVRQNILALRAYRGGDELLRALHDMDIIDKHRMIMPLVAVAWGPTLAETLAPKLEEIFPDGKIAFIGLDMPSLNLLGSIVPTSLIVHKEYSSNRPATALFGADSPLPRMHVIPTLRKMGDLVAQIVDDFKSILRQK